jgi:hypothetical protein
MLQYLGKERFLKKMQLIRYSKDLLQENHFVMLHLNQMQERFQRQLYQITKMSKGSNGFSYYLRSYDIGFMPKHFRVTCEVAEKHPEGMLKEEVAMSHPVYK